jgi:hypothetical protein
MPRSSHKRHYFPEKPPRGAIFDTKISAQQFLSFSLIENCHIDFGGSRFALPIAGGFFEKPAYSLLVHILDTKSKRPTRLYAIERMRGAQIFRYEGFRAG